MQKDWEDIINHSYIFYSGCIIEKKKSIFYWNGKPIAYTLANAKRYIDKAIKQFGKSIKK